MTQQAEKLNHLLNQLEQSFFNNDEAAEAYLKELGYDAEKTADAIVNKVNQTIAKIRREYAKQSQESILKQALSLFQSKFTEQQVIKEPKQYFIAVFGNTQNQEALTLFSKLEHLSPEEAIENMNDELLLNLIEELNKENA